jgi:large subunit ribosomal protein L21
MNFAVIQTGGKQYKIAEGDTIKIEKILGDFKVGDKIVFDQVLLTDNGNDTVIGTPFIQNSKVEATLEEIGRNQKVIIMRYKQKNRAGIAKNGHRQPFFKVKINKI